jgi:imidazolonepropionase-like amidohydrolase
MRRGQACVPRWPVDGVEPAAPEEVAAEDDEEMRMTTVSIGRRAVCANLLAAAISLIFQPLQAQTPAGATVALTGARLIDGTGAAAVENATIVIASGRIVAAGPSASVTVPAGATRISMAGKTILPGLINTHGHVTVDDNTKLPMREHMLQVLKAYADYGVTAVVSLGSSTLADEAEGFRIREEQRNGMIDRTRLITAGMNAIGKTPEEARASVARLASVKADLIKYHINGRPDDMTPDIYGALVDEAKKRNLMTAVHIFYLKDAKLAIEKGTNHIVHSVRDQDVDQELIAAMKRNNVAYVPTLTRDLSVFVYETEPAFWQEAFFKKGMYRYQTEVDILKDPKLQMETRNSAAAQSIKKALQQANRNLKILSDAGVLIGMGTDTSSPNDLGRWPGYFEHVELEMMVQAGLTPMQALKAATGDAARIMKLDQLGTIAPGKAADLLVLNANPLTNIRNTREIDSVWIAGKKL